LRSHAPLGLISPPPVGGNHEAANYLWELYYGGWAAPDIFFLGYAGVVRFGGIRIGGLSGIYKEQHYGLGHFERPPYNAGSMRSAYHIRELEVGRGRLARGLLAGKGGGVGLSEKST
jgi:hypothetical protein